MQSSYKVIPQVLATHQHFSFLIVKELWLSALRVTVEIMWLLIGWGWIKRGGVTAEGSLGAPCEFTVTSSIVVLEGSPSSVTDIGRSVMGGFSMEY